MMIVSSFMLFVAINILTPRPKKYGILFGWILFELLEHIIFPLIVIVSLFFISASWFLILLVVIFIFYGRVFGKAKSMIDWVRVFWIYFMFLTSLFLPGFMFLLFYGMATYGSAFLIFLMLITAIIWKKDESIKRKLNDWSGIPE